MDHLAHLILDPETLSNKNAAIEAKKWLDKKPIGDLCHFSPHLGAMAVACHLEPGTPHRKALNDAIYSGICEEMDQPMVAPLLDWYLSKHNGKSLALEFNTIVESQSSEFTSRDDLVESLAIVYEQAKTDVATDYEPTSELNVWFLSILSCLNIEGIENAFKTFLAFMKAYNFRSSESHLLSYCLGEDLGDILDQALSIESFDVTYYDSLEELAKKMELNSLAYYASANTSSCDHFYNSDVQFDKDQAKGALITFLEDKPCDFVDCIKYANEHYSEESIFEALEEYSVEEHISIFQDVNNLPCDFTVPNQADVLYALIKHYNTFNLDDEFTYCYQVGEEHGAFIEMFELLKKHSIFDLNETYVDDGEKFLVRFQVKELLEDLNREGDLFDEYAFEGYHSIEDFLTDMAIDNQLTSSQNDLAVPYCGFSGFDAGAMAESIEFMLNDNIFSTDQQLAA